MNKLNFYFIIIGIFTIVFTNYIHTLVNLSFFEGEWLTITTAFILSYNILINKSKVV